MDELFRRYRIGKISREVAQDFVFKGVALRAGDKVLVLPGLRRHESGFLQS